MKTTHSKPAIGSIFENMFSNIEKSSPIFFGCSCANNAEGVMNRLRNSIKSVEEIVAIIYLLCKICLIINCITVGDRKTSTSPSNANRRDLEASDIFFSSPLDSMNLNPDKTMATTAINTENDIAKFTKKYTNPCKSPYPARANPSKLTNDIFNTSYLSLP